MQAVETVLDNPEKIEQPKDKLSILGLGLIGLGLIATAAWIGFLGWAAFYILQYLIL
ncbi:MULTISPECIES: hypothetical protein [Methylorubrum]|uniref:Uncharacterized protein n=1 Tax=Methylorubrum suomiense TaxID=144191 RepID=A0ABQ4USC4_9HYPH|nr:MULTISPECIES: hypothetical protein [Methylobacteriaceae]GJE75075.1 hypothetical protein BGCPKDLD_1652 [Methylorubrum suomiense]